MQFDGMARKQSHWSEGVWQLGKYDAK